MSTPKELLSKQLELAVKRFQEAGGKIQRIPEGQKSDPAELKNQWGRPRKKKPVDKPE
jgi:hypothetical protein